MLEFRHCFLFYTNPGTQIDASAPEVRVSERRSGVIITAGSYPVVQPCWFIGKQQDEIMFRRYLQSKRGCAYGKKEAQRAFHQH